MKVKTNKKYAFSGINVKPEVANRFRKYSKTISKTHSESLALMLRFFRVNQISPHELIGSNMKTLEEILKKRLSGIVAIIKDIEKNQSKPTKDMLELLFKQAGEMEDTTKPLMLEKNHSNYEEQLSFSTDDYFKNQLEELTEEYQELLKNLGMILDHAYYVKPGFGSGYVRVEISRETLDQLKNEMRNVYHHYSTET